MQRAAERLDTHAANRGAFQTAGISLVDFPRILTSGFSTKVKIHSVAGQKWLIVEMLH